MQCQELLWLLMEEGESYCFIQQQQNVNSAIVLEFLKNKPNHLQEYIKNQAMHITDLNL